jgi:hypothetical protein
MTFLFYSRPETLGLQESDPAEYYYLNRTGGVYDVPDADDTEEFQATLVHVQITKQIS